MTCGDDDEDEDEDDHDATTPPPSAMSMLPGGRVEPSLKAQPALKTQPTHTAQPSLTAQPALEKEPPRPFGSWFDSRFGPSVVETRASTSSSTSSSIGEKSNVSSSIGGTTNSGSNSNSGISGIGWTSLTSTQRSVRKLDILVSKSTPSKDFLEDNNSNDGNDKTGSGNGLGYGNNGGVNQEIVVISQSTPRSAIPSIPTSPSRL